MIQNLKNTNKTLYNATIITMNKQMELIENGFITIENKRITNIGKGVPTNMENSIDMNGQLIIPGFINAHTHLPMTLYRGIADDLPLHEWLTEHIWPAEAKCNNDKNIRIGAKLGLAEMIKTGTTTFCDMYFFADAIAEETEKSGLKAVMGEAVIDFKTNNYNNVDEAFTMAENFIKKWQSNALIYPGMIMHSTYTCGKETLLKAKQIANKYKIPFTIHISETEEELDIVTKAQGVNPAELLSQLNILDKSLSAAHCVWLTDTDMDNFRNTKANVVHCPSSNLKLGSGIARVPQMLAKGINVALGTDGCASNNNLNMIEEMRLAALIHKGNEKNPTVVTDREALAMATINGAKALGLENETGSLEIGKLADMQIIDLNNTFMTPIYDYYSAVVYAMNSSCIQTLISNGKPLMINQELQTLNEQEIYDDLKNWKGC